MNARFSIPHALAAYIAEQAAQPFAWQRHNCCHFVAGWVRTATGADPMQGLPATPDRRAAAQLIRRIGGSLAGAWSRQLGRAPILPELASTGDIVLVHADAEGGAANGRHVALLTEGEGIAMLPMTQARFAWRLRPEGAA
jgi:hypothetical protein